MGKEFEDVIRFNQEVIHLEPNDCLNEERVMWFSSVINEELQEFIEANKKYVSLTRSLFTLDNDPATEDRKLEIKADMIDAIIDLIYFAYGRLYEIGATPDDFECMWNAIQTANMNKVKGNKGRGSDQDAVKPATWVGPEQTFINYKKSKLGNNKQLDTAEQTPCNENLKLNLTDPSFQGISNISENVNTISSNEAKSPVSNVEEFVITPIHRKIWEQLSKHKPEGVKYDNGKPNLSLVFGGFAKALKDVGYVGTFGAKKYSPNGWKYVPELQERYMSALERHALDVLDGKVYDEETGRLSIAHVAWNALAVLQDSLSKLDYDSYNKAAIAQSNATLEKYFKAKKEQNNG